MRDISNIVLSEFVEINGLTVYECCDCHWRFIGNCERYGWGYDSEQTEIPNFCPMCGEEIFR